jgi:hypothetical protein
MIMTLMPLGGPRCGFGETFMPPCLYGNFVQMSDSNMQLFTSLENSHSPDVLVVTILYRLT